MKKHLIIGLVLMTGGALFAQSPTGSSIQRLDPALDAIVSPDAQVEVLKADYFGNLEGPVWVKGGGTGYLLFTDVSANAIYKWTPDGNLSVFLDHTGFYSLDTSSLQTAGYVGGYNGRFYPVSFGTSSVAVDPQGRVVWTAQGDRQIVRLEENGLRTILAIYYQDKRLNRPNDLVVRSDGSIYFTDPHSNNPGADQELPGSIYRVFGEGHLQMLANDVAPNGIAFSPDEKYLYIGGAKLLRYDVQPNGTINNVKEVSPIGCDGIKTDLKGNIYCAANTGDDRGIRILTPEGKHLGTILTPQDGAGPTNLAFGDADGKTLYITIKRTLARIRMNATGYLPNLAK